MVICFRARSGDLVLHIRSQDHVVFKCKYDEEGIVDIVTHRMHWLLIFFLGLMIAAFVTEMFEEVLKQQVQLAYFVPVLIGHGGNAGSQAVTTMIRALALKQVDPFNWDQGCTICTRWCVNGTWRRAGVVTQVFQACVKESSAGAIMGGGLGLVIYGGSHLWSGLDEDVGLVVCIGLLCVSFLANMLGAFLPCLSVRCGFNPAVSSAPLMTTIVDALGLVIYFWIAKFILGI